MSKKTHVAMLTILAAMVLVFPSAYTRAANDTKAPVAAPADKPAGEPKPAEKDFVTVGQPAGEQAPAGTPAEGKTPPEGQPEDNTTEEQPPQSPLMKYFPFIMIGGFLVLWMFMGRSRKKKEAQRRSMLDNLSKGDRVVTIGGIVGTIVETRDSEIVVKVDDNTRMKFARWAVRNAGEAANEDKKKDTQEQQ